MTVMETMLLCSSIDLYEMNLLRLVEQRVQQRRDVLVKLYSPQLSDLVLSMLTIDDQKRPGFTEVLNNPVLRSYSSKISLSSSNGMAARASRAFSFAQEPESTRKSLRS